MKKFLYPLSIFILLSCNSENAGDCLQTTGKIIEQEVTVENFTKILVNRDVALILKQGNEQKVVIKTGSNLINDVTAVVTDGKLILTDNNTCNYVRDYNVTKVYVTAPNITEIRSSTQCDIRSDGVLTYPSLALLSEDYGMPDTFTNANFYMEVETTTLRLTFNNLSNAYISGKAETLGITFAAGTSRFEGKNLIAQNINIWNRSSNDMLLNPQQSITGRISGVGNVICVTRPAIVEVEQQYKGRLIFE
ncbi:MAG: head GIN domain-containing protein [Flavobacteriaceae bacterium]